MRFLFIVQGEGRGHMTQALSLAAILRRHGHEVVGVLVGRSLHREVPAFFVEKIGVPVDTFEAPHFAFSGTRVSVSRTVFSNLQPSRIAAFMKSMRFIRDRLRACRPEAVVNFYEMLSGLAFKRYRIRIPMAGVGHQFLFNHRDYPHSRRTGLSGWLLRLHSRLSAIGCCRLLGLSFYPMPSDSRRNIVVVPPLLRDAVLAGKPSQGRFILGYVVNNAYASQIRDWCAVHPEWNLKVFWDKRDASVLLSAGRNLTFHRIDDRLFLDCMRRCAGYVTTAGFESVCEAMYYGKPMLLVPAHIEQRINAADAASIGAGIVCESFDLNVFSEYLAAGKHPDPVFREWVEGAEIRFAGLLAGLKR